MEVFLRGIPAAISEDKVSSCLRDSMDSLEIKDWMVTKPRRNTFAFVTFLNNVDGQKFLQRYGTISNPLASSPLPSEQQPVRRLRESIRLSIAGSGIRVHENNCEPDQLLLSHLRHEKNRRLNATCQVDKAPAVNFAIAGVSCGNLIFTTSSNRPIFIEQTGISICGQVKFGRKHLTIVLGEGIHLDMDYVSIQEFIIVPPSKNALIILEEPPKFYSRAEGGFHDESKWVRQTSSPLWKDHATFVAHCLVYQLTFCRESRSMYRCLRARNILPVSEREMVEKASEGPHLIPAMQRFEASMQRLGSLRSCKIPFPILFMVQTLVWNDFLYPSQASLTLDVIRRKAEEFAAMGRGFPMTTDSLKQLLPKIPFPVTGVTAVDLDPEHLIQNAIEAELELCRGDPTRQVPYGPQIPQYHTWVFRAIVSPTRVMLLGPEAEPSNRILRTFKSFSDHFLRVSFADEDGKSLRSNHKVHTEAVYGRYRKVLRDGIRIADRLYSFLGFSNSSLRAHSVWFFAPFMDADARLQDHDAVLKHLGDFSNIRVVAKCAARIGQAFSEIPYAVNMVKTGIDVSWIDDVKSADGTRVFSDGVGTISREAMEEFWKAQPPESGTPTCFQIRWGGVKGMLAFDSRLTGKRICVRKDSMMKFPSKNVDEIGICGSASAPMPLFLNRQMIKILEDMGTDPQWFMAVQNKAVAFLKTVTSSAVSTSLFLKDQAIGRPVDLPNLINQLGKLGIDYRCDKFLKAVVEHAVLRDLRMIKHKTRIPVDQGVTLFGVMDETGFLEADEIYVTFERGCFRNGASMSPSLVDGTVLVTRSPALHPGDIQLAKMVTPPVSHQLRNLKNCVVFSQKGSRDLPSKLSGGDLDGDLYNVIWDAAAMPKETFEPADYPRVEPTHLDRNVTRDDIAQFFVDFMRSDSLGLIAARHMILADVRPAGSRDADCVKLAQMHSTAVDYSKTGIAVDLIEMPKPPRTRPDL